MRATGIQTQNSRPEYRALLILRSASALLLRYLPHASKRVTKLSHFSFSQSLAVQSALIIEIRFLPYCGTPCQHHMGPPLIPRTRYLALQHFQRHILSALVTRSE